MFTCCITIVYRRNAVERLGEENPRAPSRPAPAGLPVPAEKFFPTRISRSTLSGLRAVRLPSRLGVRGDTGRTPPWQSASRRRPEVAVMPEGEAPGRCPSGVSGPGGNIERRAQNIALRFLNSSSERMRSKAAIFSSRWVTVEVPGMGIIEGERFRSQARAS